ncbi:MAG: FkbM family methyltransferase [Verrucomicrobia bacterium]|nr:FkbM family methyltransferase [Verrucomicrobiota bacterium]
MKLRTLIRQAMSSMLERYGYEVRKPLDIFKRNPDRVLTPHIRVLLDLLSRPRSDFFFVQLGANIGGAGDPIYEVVRRHKLAGLLVEPQTAAFAKLKAAYGQMEQVILENVAIAPQRGSMTLYKLNPKYTHLYPYDPSGIASFSADHIIKHVPGGASIPDLIIEETVKTVPLSELLEAHHVQRIDLLQIDTEGYDFEILKMVDFRRFQPTLINLEHLHLSPADCEACLELLLAQGYRVHFGPDDIVAYRPLTGDSSAA